MRVGLLIYGSLYTISGAHLYDRKLVEALRYAGDTVDVISIPRRTYLNQIEDNFSRSLKRQLIELKADLLIEDAFCHPSVFWLNQHIRSSVPYPILSIIHHLPSSEENPFWRRWFYNHIERRYLNSLDGFIFNSLTTRSAVENYLSENRSGVVAYPAGDQFDCLPDENEISTRCRQPGPLRLLFLGNVIRRKGLHWALQELSRLPDDIWRLDVVGSLAADPAYVTDLRRQVKRLGLETHVKFYNALTTADLCRRFAHNHLLVVPSYYEGYGIIYLEAMSFGMVPVASTSGAAGEIITDGLDGFLVNTNDSGGLATLVETLYRDRDKLNRMGLAARRRFEMHPTWQQTTTIIRNFLLLFLQNRAK
ncbi:MAG: glycosyltransferase family 4 protein [Anaerolineae bacterium]|nr:glycosyltransferase family 4 protein [Anaerolineae bacterium]